MEFFLGGGLGYRPGLGSRFMQREFSVLQEIVDAVFV